MPKKTKAKEEVKKEEVKEEPVKPKRKPVLRGGVIVAKEAREIGSVKVEQWMKTPLQLLQDFCQKEKRSRPIFHERNDGNRFRYHLLLPDDKLKTKDLTFCTEQSFDNDVDAKNFVCLLALYHFSPSLPLERKLPDLYKDAWLGLVKSNKESNDSKVKKNENDSKNEEVMMLTNKYRFVSQYDRDQFDLEKEKSKASKSAVVESKYSKVKMADSHRKFVENILTSLNDKNDDFDQIDEIDDIKELIQDLTALGFDPNSSKKAAVYSSRKNLNSKNEMQEMALEWLVLNVPEDQLPSQFDPRKKQIQLVNTSKVLRSDNTKKITPNLIDNDSLWQETCYLLGLNDKVVLQISSSFTSNNECLRGLFTCLYSHWKSTPSLKGDDDDFEPGDMGGSLLLEQMEILESIYGENFVLVKKFNPGTYWRVKICSLWVDFIFLVGMKYSIDIPIILLKEISLSPIQRLLILQNLVSKLTEFDAYSICSSLEECLNAGSNGLNLTLPKEFGLSEILEMSERSTKASVKEKEPKKEIQEVQDLDITIEDVDGTTKVSAKRWEDRAPKLLKNDEKVNRELLNLSRPAPATILPAHGKKDDIISLLKLNDVVVITGETGCGKSTQVPQFVLDSCIDGGHGSLCNILVTQPRRISALGLAERVAAERNEKVGETVGYSVRMQSKISAKTRISYVTTGILLRRLTSNSLLTDVSHVIIDEVHERSVEIDLLLLLLKQVLELRPGFKIILMSATASSDLFSGYFYKSPTLHISGRTFPVSVHYLEEIISESGYAPVRPNFRSRGKRTEDDKKLREKKIDSLTSRGYSEKTIKSLSFIEEGVVDPELITATLWHIIDNFPPAGILVFVPGVSDIADTISYFTETVKSKGKQSNFLIMELHAGVPASNQTKIFAPVKSGVYKVIVSTNIAETSITLPDIVYVIDSGRMKETQYDPSSKMGSLVETWTSKANSIQRAGRAGRVSSGHCFRLFSEETFQSLPQQQIPEIHRSPLEHVCMQVKLMSKQGLFGNISFESSKQYSSPNININVVEHDEDSLLLSDDEKDDDGGIQKETDSELLETPAPIASNQIEAILLAIIEPPNISSIKASMEILVGIGAMTPDTELTPLGTHIAKMPIDVRLGKMLLYGAMFRCVTPVCIIAALLSNKSPWVVPLDKRDEANTARSKFACHKSDHITLLRVYQAWQKVKVLGRAAENEFCYDNFLSKQTLESVEELVSEYISSVADVGFISHAKISNEKRKFVVSGSYDENAENIRVVKGVICAGLYPNIMRALPPNKRYTLVAEGAIPKVANPKEIKYFTEQERVFMHPSGVNFNNNVYESPWLVYLSKVKTSKVFIRDNTMVSAYSLLLFGGEINVDRKNGFIIVGSTKWIRFHADLKIAVLIKELRVQLDKLLLQKVKEPVLDISSSPVIDGLLRLLSSEGSESIK